MTVELEAFFNFLLSRFLFWGWLLGSLLGLVENAGFLMETAHLRFYAHPGHRPNGRWIIYDFINNMTKDTRDEIYVRIGLPQTSSRIFRQNRHIIMTLSVLPMLINS